ncbi:MAG: hypothetical protein KKH91_01315 [Elusimicrobia bacterium]|nr:hypothetical protein [Elusimicrobiota bacterium]MBU2614640.1 hypothetical protein [Elusimicrobiota bacterium]
MFKNFVGLMFLVVFAAGTAVFAQSEGCKTSCPMAKKSCSCKGEVISVDTAANTISLKCKKGDCQVSLTDKTKIMQGKDVKTISDINSGVKVIIKYSTKDGKNEAKKVLIEPVAPSGKKK